MTVQVSDGSLVATQAIAVTVTNVNEAPTIAGGPTRAVSVAENSTAVATVAGSDPDAGATLTYAIAGGADAGKFSINASTGALSFLAAPDFETPTDAGANNVYDVTVQVSDGSLVATQAIAVTVTNVNEAPTIAGGPTRAVSVAENSTAVTTVAGSDPDAATTLTYAIAGGADAAKFLINASTGALSFVSAPDFETPTDAGANNVYDVVVQVSDGALTATQAVAVTVTDVNEAPSIAGGPSRAVSVAENSLAITTVVGGDPDAGATLTYVIAGGADAAKFLINASTGALSFVAAPDFETPTDLGANNVYDVVVQVSDGSLVATQAIAVTVTDVNEAPTIAGGPTRAVSVAENSTAVTTVAGSDPDAATTLSYAIVGGADAAKFTINASTGALQFVTAPNFEAPTDAGGNNVYDVNVRVSDGSLTATQAIAVSVTNVNEAPTIYPGPSNTYSVSENTTGVATLISYDQDAGDTLTYSIAGGADGAKFLINASTGALSFVAAPNFEAPTDAGANNVYDVIVQVSDGSLVATQAIAVTVTDVNEAPSIAGGPSRAVSVAENSTAVTTVAGSDPDAATTLTYSIAGGADAAKFLINASTGALSFVSAPDFETPTDLGANNVYDVVVQVSDGALTATQAIAVTVTDVNEAPSIAGGAARAVSVAENSLAITTVVGGDPDAGATLTYAIAGGADAGKFSINASTGALSFLAAPDFEAPTDAGANNVYDVVVQVSDGALTATQALAVTVTNVNEAPTIAGGPSRSVSVAENGAAVTTVVGGDPDAGATLTYSIAGGADAAKFLINASTGALSFVSAPDFEAPTDAGANNIYDVVVQVSDGSLVATQAVAVTVTDVNEAPSIAGGAARAVSVGENLTAVTTVVGGDPDAGATLTYSIAGGADAAKFLINASTGALSFVSAPDFEAPTDAGANNIYDVVVQVSDGSLVATQAVAVTVTDVNEAPSIAGGAARAVSVAENSLAVTTVVGGDPDAGATLTYAIAGGADAGKFSINASTGALSFLAAPDFENPTDAGANNVYDVTVQVSDGSLVATQAIAVTVTDVNEAPTIAGGPTRAVSVAENSTAVTTVAGSDPDAATTLSYAIAGGADASHFTINAATGALAFVAPPDYEAPTDVGSDNVYNVTVQVSDGSLVATQAVAVTVLDVNEAPVIASDGGGATASLSHAENSLAVTIVTAVDPDAGASLTYAIAGGADASRFTINAATGALAFVTTPDFEAPTDVGLNNVYDVVVQVSDGSLVDTQAIAVTVTNVNEAPHITSGGGAPTAYAAIDENSLAVTTVTALDPDGGTTLTYSIAGGVDASHFVINASTGALSFVTAPDFENPTDVGGNEIYDVTVQVSDGSLVATQAIAVEVFDVNEAPHITSDGGGPTAVIAVPENTTAVTTVVAVDPDAGTSLYYYIAGGNDFFQFTIDSNTGALSFVTPPDYESPGSSNGDNAYDVVVGVWDGALTETQQLTVNVTDQATYSEVGTSGSDFLWATNENSTLTGLDGTDILFGGVGNDTLYGGNGDDGLYGGSGDDNLFGGAGADTLDAGGGTNRLEGGDGADTLIGTTGDDKMFGGDGDDTFVLDSSQLSFAGAGLEVHGDAGADTLILTTGAPATVSAATLAQVVTGVETIDFRTTNISADFTNFTSAEATSILGASGPGNTLTLKFNGDDTFTVAAGEHFTQSGADYTFYADVALTTEIAKVSITA